MPTSFSELIADVEARGGVHRLLVSEDWMQGRTAYGGLTAAFALEAALAAAADPPPLRSAQISFIGPASGALTARAGVLRRGRSALFVGADVSGEKGLAARAVFVFGAARKSAFDLSFLPPPELPGPTQSEEFLPPGMGPNFAQHYESRLAAGGRPVSGSTAHDHFIWVRHRDLGARDLTALIALADMPPPAVLPMFTEFAPISSVTWMLNVLTAAPATEDGWWLMESRAENAAEGYSSQDMFVWNSRGEAVIAGRQSVALFA